MTLTSKQIVNLPVFTESGIKVGKVSFLELNEKEHVVEKYVIKTSSLMQLMPAVILVSPKQIIEINSKKVIVEENIIKLLKKRNKQKKLAIEGPSPVLYIDLT